MKKCFLLILIMFCAILSGQMNNLVQINAGLGDVFFRGSEAYTVIDNEVCLAFVEDSLAANLWFSHSSDGFTYINTLIDSNVYRNEFALPTIEVFPEGKIVIFFIETIEGIKTLLEAVSIDNGASFEIESIDTEVSEFTTCLDGDELYLYYKRKDNPNMTYFHYFTQLEATENSGNGTNIAYFTGQNVLTGPVHSNDDIWISNLSGWPTFEGPVTTAGRVRIYPSGELAVNSAPCESIFLGGLQELVTPIYLPVTVDSLALNAQTVGEGYDIVYVKICGSSMQTMFGEFISNGTQDFDVYSWYPHDQEVANSKVNNGNNWFTETDNVYQNHIEIVDTVWTNGPTLNSSFNGISYFVPDAELWIEGDVSGKVTWICKKNAYLVGDVTYLNTIIGSAPDDPNNPNISDYFGLISEKKIIIRYKHRDPFMNNIIRDDNCSSLYLYGAYAAIGEGDASVYGNLACHYDGIFTFEYQHPHGSTPDFNALSPYSQADTIYSYIDFHKFIFPAYSNLPNQIAGFGMHGNIPAGAYQTCGFPYETTEYLNSYPNDDPDNYAFPYGTDYPWYNPVWPESAEDIVFERGTVNLWGSIIQRRRGFLHRSGIDSYNHPSNNNEWDLENFHFGGTHPSTGYSKDYHSDSRLIATIPNFFFNANTDNLSSFILKCSDDEGVSFEQLHNKFYSSDTHLLDCKADSNLVTYITVTNDQHFNIDYFYFGYPEIYSETMYYPDTDYVNVIADRTSWNHIYYCLHDNSINNDQVYDYCLFNNTINSYYTFYPPFMKGFYCHANNDSRVYTHLINMIGDEILLNFQYTESASGNFSQELNWQFPFVFNELGSSRIYLNFDQQNYAYVGLLNSNNADVTYGDLWIAKGELPNLTGVTYEQLPETEYFLYNYPNPFNPTTTITFSVPQTALFATIEIYNIKGQNVKTLDCCNSFAATSGSYRMCSNTVTWNGGDENGKQVTSGIYFYKLKAGKVEKTRKMLLLK